MTSTDPITANIEYLAVFAQQRDRIKAEKRNCVLPMCTQLKKHKTCEPERFSQLDSFLQWLATEARVSPTLNAETQLDQVLRLIFEPDQLWQFPEAQRKQAEALHGRFSATNWGKAEEDKRRAAVVAAVAVRDEAAPKVICSFDQSAEDSSRPSTRPARVSDPAELRLPDQNHPIFGRQGIMWGLACKGSSSKPYINPECPKKDFKAFGNNGLTVGEWWPRQLAALVHGAHGCSQGGISGAQGIGAYSIVVSGTYDGLDSDQGDVLYYSGSSSHDNKDPKSPSPSSAPTLLLKASITSKQPVRVLRAASGDSIYSPSYGLRYDGLYRVVGSSNKVNTHGGLYEQFKLERLTGQTPLRSIASPTGQQVIDYHKIIHRY